MRALYVTLLAAAAAAGQAHAAPAPHKADIAPDPLIEVEAQGDAAYEDEAPAGWGFTATTGVVSDYRYRGVSMSNRDPAFQADATLYSPDGLYFYGWVSEMETAGDDVELMGSVGWSGAFFSDNITLDASANLYAYPGVTNSSLFELAANFTRTFGPVAVTSGIAYFPEQENLGDLDDTYLSLTAETPLGFWDAAGTIGLGWEQGAFGEGKVDWIAAVDLPINKFSLRLAYAGAERHFYGSNGGNSLFAEVRYNFGE